MVQADESWHIHVIAEMGWFGESDYSQQGPASEVAELKIKRKFEHRIAPNKKRSQEKVSCWTNRGSNTGPSQGSLVKMRMRNHTTRPYALIDYEAEVTGGQVLKWSHSRDPFSRLAVDEARRLWISGKRPVHEYNSRRVPLIHVLKLLCPDTA